MLGILPQYFPLLESTLKDHYALCFFFVSLGGWYYREVTKNAIQDK